MAGGPFAAVVCCMTCGARADRTYEGLEDDHYLCIRGHTFGIDWSRSQPTEPQWPPTPEQQALLLELFGKYVPETIRHLVKNFKHVVPVLPFKGAREAMARETVVETRRPFEESRLPGKGRRPARR